MNVSIVGTGYVGLVTGVCLAERGNEVLCIDTNPAIVEKLNARRGDDLRTRARGGLPEEP